MAEKNRIKILGIPVDMVDFSAAMSRFQSLMEEPGCSLVVTPNSEILINAARDAELKKVIEEADLVIPDGVGLVYASKIIGAPLKERVTGIDFLGKILLYLEDTSQSIYLLGSKPGGEGEPSVAQLAAEKMKEKHPNLRMAGTHHGYFSQEDEPAILEEINASGADFLCVALGSPKQELFIRKHQDMLKAKAAIGVGGSLDVWAGTLKRAPAFYRKHGLEWLYRFIQQPGRYKRLAALPAFIIKVIISKFKGGN